MLTRFKLPLAVAAGLYLGTLSAQAATVSCGNVDYTATVAEQSTAVCSSGNLNESGDISFDGMTFGLGIRDSGASVSGSPMAWVTDPMSNELGTGMLDWSISLASDWMGVVLLELKQASTYALFDVTDSCNFATNSCGGFWSTSGPGRSSNDLSHTRAWYMTTDDGGGPSPVPLPAAGWMLIAALLGMAGMRKRA